MNRKKIGALILASSIGSQILNQSQIVSALENKQTNTIVHNETKEEKEDVKNISDSNEEIKIQENTEEKVEELNSKLMVIFDTQGGSEISPLEVEADDLITEPTAPTRDGYKFDGWYTDDTFSTAWNFGTDKMPSNDITLYAKWNINLYNVGAESKDKLQGELEKEKSGVLVEEKQSSSTELKSEENEEIKKSNISILNVDGFNLADWQKTETTTSITLTGYNGSDTNIVIPGEYNGKEIILNTFLIFPENMTSLEIKEINGKKVKVNINANYTSNYTFSRYQQVKKMDLRGLDVSNFTSFLNMFYNCNNLQSVDVSGWNTSNVSSMDNTFLNCSNLISIIGLDAWDVSNVTSMSNMFRACNNLQSIDVSGWNTSNLKYIDGMFYDCKSLTSLDVNNWNTSNLKSLSYTFSGVWMQTINLSNWDVSNVTNMTGVFSNSRYLKNIIGISDWNVSNVVTMRSMFAGVGIETIDLSKWDVSKVTNMSYMFQATELKYLDAGEWNTSNVTSMVGMFINANDFVCLNAKKWDTSKVTDMSQMFLCGTLGNWKLLVITNDKNLREYDYTQDNRIPSGPTFYTNGGKFLGDEIEKQVSIFVIEDNTDDCINKALEEAKNNMEIPTYEEHTFVNWVKNPYDKPNDLLEVWDKLNAEYVAEWKINSYDVTFDSQGGSNVDSQTVAYNGLIKEPTAPTKEGYTFAGWYKEQSCTTPWDFKTDTMPASNITLYAKWTINGYKVTFDSQGGSQVAEADVNFDELVKEPTAPTKEGYTFGGWYKEPDCQNAWDFTTEKMPSNNVTLYAKWTINGYKVTFDSQGGSQVAEADVNFDELVKEPTAPTKEGYTFGGWYKEPDCQNAWDFTTEKMPSNNVTLYAKWNMNIGIINAIPTITASDKVLTVGDEFNPLEGVTANDAEDGKITLTEANIIANDVNMSKSGTYIVRYKVTDSKGASSLKTITVVVKPKSVIVNEAPVIIAEGVTIEVGSNFYPLNNVRAQDKEDGDLTKKIKVIENTVNIDKTGIYSVTYEVTDSNGSTTRKTIVVTVKEKQNNIIDEDTNSSNDEIKVVITEITNSNSNNSLNNKLNENEKSEYDKGVNTIKPDLDYSDHIHDEKCIIHWLLLLLSVGTLISTAVSRYRFNKRINEDESVDSNNE